MRKYDVKLVDSSRIIADMLVADIGNSSERFFEMLNICFRDEYPLSMRAARVIALCAERHPSLINDHVMDIVHQLNVLKTEGVRRGFLKIFTDHQIKLEEEPLGYLTDLCFDLLDDPKQALAIRYYSLEILINVAQRYPELGNELLIIINTFNENSPPSLQAAGAKAKKILTKLS